MWWFCCFKNFVYNLRLEWLIVSLPAALRITIQIKCVVLVVQEQNMNLVQWKLPSFKWESQTAEGNHTLRQQIKMPEVVLCYTKALHTVVATKKFNENVFTKDKDVSNYANIMKRKGKTLAGATTRKRITVNFFLNFIQYQHINIFELHVWTKSEQQIFFNTLNICIAQDECLSKYLLQYWHAKSTPRKDIIWNLNLLMTIFIS